MRRRFNPALAMLAHDWRKRKKPDPAGWWMSEKYDGIRALWDGRRFVSRNGNVFYAPDWFVKGLPDVALDGELWIGRGMANFQEAVSIVRSHDAGRRWEKVRYLVFDMPESSKPFEQVQLDLRKFKLGKYAQVVPQEKVKSRAHLERRLKDALRVGAEGLMIRAPRSRYEKKRSYSLLKIKPIYDTEAIVTGYQAGTGKHQGRMGAVLAELVSDRTKKFKIGTGFSDAEREDPPPIGSIVEFQYSDLTKAGIPRHPAFLRIRSDLAPRAKPRKAAPKAARKKTTARKPKYELIGPVITMILSEGGSERKVVVLRLDIEGRTRNVAFYESTGKGTPGLVAKGEWTPFNGISRLRGGWVIKGRGKKATGELLEASQWLARQEKAGQLPSQMLFEPTDSGKEAEYVNFENINSYLLELDALTLREASGSQYDFAGAAQGSRKIFPRGTRFVRKELLEKADREDFGKVAPKAKPKPKPAPKAKPKLKPAPKPKAKRKAAPKFRLGEVVIADGHPGEIAEFHPASGLYTIDLVYGQDGSFDAAPGEIRRVSKSQMIKWLRGQGDEEYEHYANILARQGSTHQMSGARRLRDSIERLKQKETIQTQLVSPAKAPSRAYFKMSKAQLVSRGDAGAKKELKRRGRDARGNKIR